MLSLLPTQSGTSTALHRRDLLKSGGLASLSALFPALQQANGGVSPLAHAPTAKNCIFIFLCGGPSQLDMWDPKPAAPAEIRGPIGSIDTCVPGIRFGEVLPKVALHADKMALIRSMMHDSTSHETGIKYTLLADSRPPPGEAYPPARTDHPGLGAILWNLLGAHPDLPAWVTIPRPFTTGDHYYKGQTGGLLGGAFDPFAIDEEKFDSLADKQFQLPALSMRQGMTTDRMRGRHALFSELNGQTPVHSASTRDLEQYSDQAFSLLCSPVTRRAFNLANEPGSLRDQYGRHEYGQSFLLARRLIETGVRMVNVFWTYYGKDGCQFNLWDNHGADEEICGGLNRGIDMLKAPYCCPSFDQAFSTLLEDLTQRGLLDETLVVVTGEFGRTPKINKWAGRDHWCSCYSTVLAGGGIRGGQIYGESDVHAAYVKDLPTRPEDLGATVLHAFGIAPEAPIYGTTNRPVRASKGTPLKSLFG